MIRNIKITNTLTLLTHSKINLNKFPIQIIRGYNTTATSTQNTFNKNIPKAGTKYKLLSNPFYLELVREPVEKSTAPFPSHGASSRGS